MADQTEPNLEQAVANVLAAYKEFVVKVSEALGPAAEAMMQFGAAVCRMVDRRLVELGLTWNEVKHLPPDALSVLLWGEVVLPPESDAPTVVVG